jgi:hypothetical protein
MRIVLAVFLLFPLSCFAVDGVLEINQSCIDTGCFDGDAAGLPITLANTGSYRLTSNINISGYNNAENLTAIEVSGNNVSIDLNGFAIIGPTTCTGQPVSSCSPTGIGLGINITGAGGRGLSVSNGHIRGMGGHGIYCALECRISNVTAVNNGDSGIVAGQQAIITGCSASRNRLNGFNLTGLVFNSVAEGNGELGMHCAACSVYNSSFLFNGTHGISFTSNSTFGGNRMNFNNLGSITGTALATAPNLCVAVACP